MACPKDRFQSTPPRGGRQERAKVNIRYFLFQSTPPRGGRPLAHDDLTVTVGRFNPRPRVGGDSLNISSPHHYCSFNPRPRVGGDDLCFIEVKRVCVSIHAPAWGATLIRWHHPWHLLFQSTPPRGGRPNLSIIRMHSLKFQSTPPRGGRRIFY